MRLHGLRFLFLVLFTVLISSITYGLGQKAPEDSIRGLRFESTQTYQNFSLVTNLGETISFQQTSNGSATTEDWALVEQLPAASSSANKKLCGRQGTSLEIELSMANIEIILGRLSYESTQIQSLLRKTPRCDPFIKGLASIARSAQMKGNLGFHIPSTARLSSVSIVRSNREYFLELKTSTDKLIYFRIPSDLKGLEEPHELTRLHITPEQSGQGIGVQFRSLDVQYDDDRKPTFSEQSCTITETHERCYTDQQGKYRCETYTVTRPGTQTVETTSSSTTYKFGMELYHSGQVIWRGNMTDYDFDSNSSKSICK